MHGLAEAREPLGQLGLVFFVVAAHAVQAREDVGPGTPAVWQLGALRVVHPVAQLVQLGQLREHHHDGGQQGHHQPGGGAEHPAQQRAAHHDEGGATMASAEFDESIEEKRPTVQVGDPFTEKCLLEACLELMASGAVIAIQDMGAAGLTCSAVEMGR